MRRIWFIALIIVAGFFIAANYLRSDNDKLACSLDGSLIQPDFEVILVQEDKSFKHFSCILSACIWFSENSGQVTDIMVTDEVTGNKIKAKKAFYVESDVITTSYTGNRIHVFSEKSAAESHASKYNGKFAANPFQGYEKKPVIVVKYKTGSQGNPDFSCPPINEPLITTCCSILTMERDASTLVQIYSNCLADGFYSLPYKPPCNIS